MNTFTETLHLFQHETGVTNWGEELNRTLGEVDRALSYLGARPRHWDKRVRGFDCSVSGRSVAISAIGFEKEGGYQTHTGGSVAIPVNPGPSDRMDLVVMDPASTSGLTLVQGTPAADWQHGRARFLGEFNQQNSGLANLMSPGALSGAILDVAWDPVNHRWLLSYVSNLGVLLGLTGGNPPMFGLAAMDPATGEVTPLNLNWRLSAGLSAFGNFGGFLPFGLSVIPREDGTGVRLFAFVFTTHGAGLMEFDETGEAKGAWALVGESGNLFTTGPLHLLDLGPDPQGVGRRVRVIGLSLGTLPWHGLNLGNFTCEALLPNTPSLATLGGEPLPLPVWGMLLHGPVNQFGSQGEQEPISVAWDGRRNRLFTVETSAGEGGFKQELPKGSLFARSLDPPWRFLLGQATETAQGLKAYGLTPEPDQPLSGINVSFHDAIGVYDLPVYSSEKDSPASVGFTGSGNETLVVSWPAGGGGPVYPWPQLGDQMAVLLEYRAGWPGQKGFVVALGQVVASPGGQGDTEGLLFSAGAVLKGVFPQGDQITLERGYLGRVIPGGSTFTARLIHLSGVPLETMQGRVFRVMYNDPAKEGSFTWMARLACPWQRPYQVAVKGYGGTGQQGSVPLHLLAFPGDLWLTYEGSLSSGNGRGAPFGLWPLGLELNRVTSQEILVGPYAGTFAFDAGTVFFYDDGFFQYQWQDPAAGPSQLPSLNNDTLIAGTPIPDYRQLDQARLSVLPPQPAWNFTPWVLNDAAKYSFMLAGRLLPEATALPPPVFSAFGAPAGVGYGEGQLCVSSLSLGSLPGGAAATWEPYAAPEVPAAPPGLIPLAHVLVRGGHTGDIAIQDVLTGPDQHLPVVSREALLEGLRRSEWSEADLSGGMGLLGHLLREGAL